MRTFWDGTEGVCRFTPAVHHTAFPGVVYGGLLASLIDCHSIGTAVAAMYDAEGRAPDTAPEITCVTASLQVDYLKPTPTDVVLELRAHEDLARARRLCAAACAPAKLRPSAAAWSPCGSPCARGRSWAQIDIGPGRL